ncbi:radical SAM protein [Desulfococcaceae bacterium HSG7]|nr:radical SAM protein [Desulfococcaceae bacterium HSG7]
MKILLVEPNRPLEGFVLPLGLGYLKSNISSNIHEVKIVNCSLEGWHADDRNFKEEVLQFKPDLLGVSASFQTYSEGLKLIEVVKGINKSIVTVMGGAHPSIYADTIMENKQVDFLFRGESELSFPIFLSQLEADGCFSSVKGLVYRQKNGETVKNDIMFEPKIDKIKIPDYKAIRINDYIEKGYFYGFYGGKEGRSAPIWLTRGCPYNCTYCSASKINGKRIRVHSISYVINWIQTLYSEFKITQFAIIDDNFTFYIDYAKEFCRKIIKLKEEKYFKKILSFSTPNGVRLEKLDDELLDLMRKAGWKEITIAPESGSRKTLKKMRKSLNPEVVPDVIKRIKNKGFYVRGFFIIGYPGETWGDIKETISLIRRSRLDFAYIGRFMPIPGTDIFNELVKKKEISTTYIHPHPSGNLELLPSKFQGIYSPKGLEDISPFLIFWRENIFLLLKKPSNILFFLRYFTRKDFRKIFIARMHIGKFISNLFAQFHNKNKKEIRSGKGKTKKWKIQK